MRSLTVKLGVSAVLIILAVSSLPFIGVTTSAEDDAFWGCSSLTKVVLNSHPDLGSKAFPSETELEYREHDGDHSAIIIAAIVAIMSAIYIIKRR